MSTTVSVCPLPFSLSLACLKQKGVILVPSPLFLYSALKIRLRNCNDLLLCALDWLTEARIQFMTH